jgi:hypothetical protein
MLLIIGYPVNTNINIVAGNTKIKPMLSPRNNLLISLITKTTFY